MKRNSKKKVQLAEKNYEYLMKLVQKWNPKESNDQAIPEDKKNETTA
jgi:hypothetical protein